MGAISEVPTKKCTKCGEVKALDAFSADKRLKCGRKSACKDCSSEYYQKNKERLRSLSRNYYQENKERVLEKHHRYYQENKDRILKFGRKYRQDNIKDIAKKRHRYRQENPEPQRRANRKRRAMKRNLPHQPLTPAQYERLYEFRDQVFGEVTS